MITTFDLSIYVEVRQRAGVLGFLLKDTPPEQLLAAIRDVAAGKLVLPAPAAGRSA